MPHSQTARLKIYYEIRGSGHPLLFISGTGADLRNKPNFLDGPATSQFETLAYDQRGLGQTDKPDESYSMADYAHDAVALLDELGWQQPHVIGVSFGGMVAQELALRHPDRINRLVLACTSPGGKGGASYPLHEVQNMDPVERAKFMIPISDTRRDAAWAAENPKEYKFFVDFASTDAFAGEPGRAMGATRQLEARKGHDTWERLPNIPHPTLVCGGTYDGIALPSTQEKLAARIPNAELAMFDGGHLFMIQDKTAVPAMLDFLTPQTITNGGRGTDKADKASNVFAPSTKQTKGHLAKIKPLLSKHKTIVTSFFVTLVASLAAWGIQTSIIEAPKGKLEIVGHKFYDQWDYFKDRSREYLYLEGEFHITKASGVAPNDCALVLRSIPFNDNGDYLDSNSLDRSKFETAQQQIMDFFREDGPKMHSNNGALVHEPIEMNTADHFDQRVKFAGVFKYDIARSLFLLDGFDLNIQCAGQFSAPTSIFFRN